MKRIAALTPIIAVAAALSAAPVHGQAQGGKPPAGGPPPAMSAEKAPAMKGEEKPAARKRARLADVDARHCLQLATNMAIHQCAEKYRPR